jgi:hypothetical protein
MRILRRLCAVFRSAFLSVAAAAAEGLSLPNARDGCDGSCVAAAGGGGGGDSAFLDRSVTCT